MPTKNLLTRSFADFKKMVDQQSANDRAGEYWRFVLSEMTAAANFEIAVIVSCRVSLSSILGENQTGKTWLTENCTKGWFIYYEENSTLIRRVCFEDEGDAFRFAWHFESTA